MWFYLCMDLVCTPSAALALLPHPTFHFVHAFVRHRIPPARRLVHTLHMLTYASNASSVRLHRCRRPAMSIYTRQRMRTHSIIIAIFNSTYWLLCYSNVSVSAQCVGFIYFSNFYHVKCHGISIIMTFACGAQAHAHADCTRESRMNWNGFPFRVRRADYDRRNGHCPHSAIEWSIRCCGHAFCAHDSRCTN